MNIIRTKKKKKATLLPLLSLILFFLLFWSLFFIYFKILQYRTINESKISSATGIESLEKITLGNLEQWILIRGENRSHPVLLVLHGGPGSALFPIARDLGLKTKLEQHFVMVYWEQRGTGKSFHFSIPKNSMTIEQLVSDVNQLTQFLLHRFNKTKIYLMARSWGTVLGLLTVSQYPEFFKAYIGIGQIINPLKNDQLSYSYTLKMAEKFSNKKAIKELRELGSPPYDYQKLLIQRRWLTKFYRMKKKNSLEGKLSEYTLSLNRLLSTPEYSIYDIFRMGFDPYYSLKHLWNEKYYQINFLEQIKEINIPIYFLVGKYDYFVIPGLTRKFYQNVQAKKGKNIILFENSGHHPSYEEPKKFSQTILTILEDLEKKSN